MFELYMHFHGDRGNETKNDFQKNKIYQIDNILLLIFIKFLVYLDI